VTAGSSCGAQASALGDLRLDGTGTGTGHLDHVDGPPIPLSRPNDQSPRYAGPPRFRRGHVSHAARRRQRGDADRRGQGRRTADPQVVCDLPRAPHPALHVHQQDGPPDARSARAARRTRERARHRRVSGQLAARRRRRRSAACTTARRTKLHTFERTEHGAKRAPVSVAGVHDEKIRALVDEGTYREFIDGIELLEGAGAPFDRDAMLRGDVTPVFFGSAMTNFGVELFLDRFVQMGPRAGARLDASRHAGRAGRRALLGVHLQDSSQHGSAPSRPGRVRAHLLGQVRARHDGAQRAHRQGRAAHARDEALRNDRESIDVAYAGDVVGLANPGSFAIGDTLCDRRTCVRRSRPSSRNISRWCAVSIPASYKSFQKGIAQLREEGAIQVLYPFGQTRTEPILAAVGALQFEVVKFRLESEYNVKTRDDDLAVHAARARERRSAPQAIALCGAVALEREAGRGLGRRAARALRERVEHAARGRVESAARRRRVLERQSRAGGRARGPDPGRRRDDRDADERPGREGGRDARLRRRDRHLRSALERRPLGARARDRGRPRGDARSALRRSEHHRGARDRRSRARAGRARSRCAARVHRRGRLLERLHDRGARRAAFHRGMGR
jgi:hypothetical protein